ncbi:MAG: hydroxyacylglutathione hydrolase [Deltaproteobacteria bacterium]|nr:hydroxyacylglutathione hydrolase [Deltaproteobacteria bacterium]
MSVSAIPIRTLKNNYAWLIVANRKHAAVIDPGEAGPVLQVLTEKGLTLDMILLTHLHPDHCGGTPELHRAFPEARIVMHPDDAGRVDFPVNQQVGEGDSIGFNENAITIMHLPCHTRGCVAYRITDYLFTGDTLFTAGCGKFFEGTATEMLANLNRLKNLPENLMICCGHEYTVENLAYATQADPDNAVLSERLATACRDEAAGRFLVPAPLSLELKTNPFLRLDNPQLQRNLGTGSDLETLIALYKIYYQQTPAT